MSFRHRRLRKGVERETAGVAGATKGCHLVPRYVILRCAQDHMLARIRTLQPMGKYSGM